ncbi:MAG: hypothetical protein JXR13_09465 [Thalassovita sp.]
MPSPEFSGLAPTRIEVEGSLFDVRVKDAKAEAIRLNPEYAPRLGKIGLRAGVAIEAVSGCTVTRIDGDAAMVRAKMRCGSGRDRSVVPDQLTYDCDIDDGTRDRSGGNYTDMTCYLSS